MKKNKKAIILVILAIAVAFSLFSVVKQSEKQKYLDSIRVNSSNYGEYLEEESQLSFENTENNISIKKEITENLVQEETEDILTIENEENLEIQEPILESEQKEENLPKSEEVNIQNENIISENLSTEENQTEIKAEQEEKNGIETEPQTTTTKTKKSNSQKTYIPVETPQETSEPAELIEVNHSSDSSEEISDNEN